MLRCVPRSVVGCFSCIHRARQIRVFETACFSILSLSSAAFSSAAFSSSALSPRVFEITSGNVVVDRRSSFQGHLANAATSQDVQLVREQLIENKKIAKGSHQMVAYRIVNENGSWCAYSDEDGEKGAGTVLKHLLDILDARNVVVIVTRWYGGVPLGPDRFKHISNCAREVLMTSEQVHAKPTPKQGKKQR